MTILIPLAKGATVLAGLGVAGYAKGAYDAVKEALSDNDSKPKKTKMR